jgi:hypothetical protein
MLFKRVQQFALVGVILTGAASATVLPNDFDSENGGVPVLNYYGFADWTVSKGAVDLIGNGYFDSFAGNGLYVDLAGSIGQFGAITSKTTYGPGTYQVTVGLGGSIYNGIADGATISWGTGSQDFVLPGLATGTYTFDVTLTSPEQFTITDDALTGNGNIGATLFGFSVVKGERNVPAPEPMTLALFGAGIAGFGALRRRMGKSSN